MSCEGSIEAMCKARTWGRITACRVKYLYIRLQPVSSEIVQARRTLLTSSGDCLGPFCAACAYDMFVVVTSSLGARSVCC